MRKDAPYGRRRQFFGRLACQVGVAPVQVLVEIRFLPESAQARGVVAARGAHGKSRVFLHLVVRGIGDVPVAGPALDAQRKDVQLLEDGGHAVRHGAQVFGAHEHVRFLREHAQELRGVLFPQGFLHGFVPVDNLAELLLLVFGQRVKHRLVVPVPERVEGILVAARNKDAVPVDLEERVLDFLRFVEARNRLLGIEFGLEHKARRFVRQALEIDGDDVFRLVTKEGAELVDRVVRAAQVFERLAAESGRAEHFPGERDARAETAQNAGDFAFGNGPDAEESEHVVNAVGVVELARLVQAHLPPAEIVFFDVVPAVGGESPVLAAVAEHVGRGARAVVHGEVVAVRPGVGAVLVDEDGNVSLDADAHLGNFSHRGRELHLGDVLHPGVVKGFLEVLVPESLDVLGGGVLEFFPVLPAGFVVLGLQDAVDAVGLGPRVLLDPVGKRDVLFQKLVSVLENLLENLALPGRYLIIVNLAAGVECLLGFVDFGFEVDGPLDGLDVDENRVQGEGAACAVGARLAAGVVHGQQLNNVEIAKFAPTGKGNQVKEFSDADAGLALETKEGNGHAALECRNITVTHAVNVVFREKKGRYRNCYF